MREPPARADVVVIGGGLAGIAAAARLKERGVGAVLLEAEAELGGKVRAVADRPLLSRGPIVWEARRKTVTRLMSMIGLEHDVVATLPAKTRYVVRDGKLRALEPNVVSMGTTRALSMRDRLRVLAEPLLPRARRSRADDDESVASFFRRRFGHDVTEGLLFAMANGIWAGDPECLSAASCFPDMVAAERDYGSVLWGTVKRRRGDDAPRPKGSLTLRGGLGRVGPAARDALAGRPGTRVESIEVRPHDVVVHARSLDGSALVLEAGAVVLAVEAPAARALLAVALRSPHAGIGLAVAEIDSILAEVSYAELALVHWQERRHGEAKLPAGFGYLSPPRERSFALGALFASDLLPSFRASAHAPRVFSSFVGGTLAPERARLTDDELARGIAAELKRLTGGAIGELLHIERVPLAVAQPTLGHGARVARLERLLSSGRIALAGSWLGAGAMKDAVASGFKAADDVGERLARPQTQRASATMTRAPSLAASTVVEPHVTNDAIDLVEPPLQAGGERRVAVAPMAIVGASYRDVATTVRARLAAAERSVEPPSRALIEAGYADGVVFLETCSRVEWLISSARPVWAAEIFKSMLAKRVPESRVHTKTGHASAHYLLRVAMGLDSVAEGEPAVGRQLVLAFERAHKNGDADRSLRLAWRGVQQLMGERRRRGVVRHGLGVQTLVIEELASKGVATRDEILVFGQGEIGRAVFGALKDGGYTRAAPHRRSTQLQFLAEAEKARAVVVCTGGPAPWLELPQRDARAMVVDIGVPSQVKCAPGWTQIFLEDLLAQPRRLLDDETRTWLVAQVHTAADRLSKDLADPVAATALGAIDDARRVFLRETLPPLLEKLPPTSAEEVRRACTAFAHHLMERVRDGTANGGGAT